jgi:hypothetical protein
MAPTDTPGDQTVDLEEGLSRPLPPAETKPYDPAPFRDKMRAFLALALVGLLGLTVFLPFLIIWWTPDRANAVHEHLGLVFTPLVALVGSAVGYYFAARTSDRA